MFALVTAAAQENMHILCVPSFTAICLSLLKWTQKTLQI